MNEEKKRKVDETATTAPAKISAATLMAPQSEWRVRVARYDYKYNAKMPLKSPDGYRNIVIHVRDPLSPYVVRDPRGCILENVWQACKLYPEVLAQRITKHKMRPNDVIWQHGSEVHAVYSPPAVPIGSSVPHVGDVSNALQLQYLEIKPDYWGWRAKLEAAEYAVRYPNGYYGRHTCMGALWPAKEGDAIAARHPDTVLPIRFYRMWRRESAFTVHFMRKFAKLTQSLRVCGAC